MKKTLVLIFCLPVLSLSCFGGLLPDNAFSKDARGSVSANFLKNVVSARFYGMGQTGSTLMCPDSIFYNPAGVYLYDKKAGLAFNYQALLEGSARTDLAYISRGENSHYGFSVTYNSYGSFDKINSLGDVYGSFSPYDYSLGYTAAFHRPGSSLGFTGKFISSSLGSEKASGIAADMGLIIHSNGRDKKEYSFLIRNLGTPLKYGSHYDPLPMEVVGGLKYPYSETFNFSMEGRLPVDDDPYLASGAELILPFQGFDFAMRAGLNAKNRAKFGFAGMISAGFGFSFSDFSLDYAYAPYGELGDTHRFSVSYTFGKFKKKSDEEEFYSQMKKRFLMNKKFAILDFTKEEGPGPANYGNIIANSLQSLMEEKGVKIISRTSFKFIEAVRNMDASYDSLLAACRKMEADYCVSGEVSPYEKGMIIKVKIFDSEAGRMIKYFGVKYEDEYKMGEITDKIAEEVLKLD